MFNPILYIHVSQVWNTQIALKVESGGRSADSRILRSKALSRLMVILFEEDEDSFYLEIYSFIARHEGAHPECINYFRANWCNEAKYNI
ncbi:hypothetical protein BDB01DRAFT_811287 [Pilobolus umbonatus]|nr:hypothetical protein BDB01DRAFT_811287 [Pilobolus umbonatus]